ncbi:MAG TPA: BREX system P-loop protein BrxC, partial [Isosphaeraceae bacterium]|nr:BREX system P-loop protein BrxC [Isosphaeraceae bacterium]
GRLEKETLISRNGDVYFFLTNEERDINREIKSVELGSGEEAKLLGELIFHDVYKDQRKYRYPENKMDFSFNRLCDLHPIGNRVDGALQVSVITPLNDDYELYDNAKCLLESGTEGGHILIRLGDEKVLGRELRTYLQTDKYVRHKNDGSLSDSSRRILRGFSEDNQDRRERLVTLLDGMLGEANYYATGQPLKLKGNTPPTLLDESLEYLVKNTFTRMGYLKHLNPDPMKEMQAILRSNDIEQQKLALDLEEGNKQAMDDVRNHVGLMASQSRQIVLYDLIEKRYSIRPYGWPDNEVLLLIARLLVLGEISLMMDGSLVPLDGAYKALTTPANRRKITILKRQTTDPKAIQAARNLGKDLFHEMGPDGEDPLFGFLQNKLTGWQTALSGYKPLADTGNYPGKEEIDEGLLTVKKLLACDHSYKFIEQFNDQKTDLLDLADEFHELEHFYEHQKPSWESLRKAYDRFGLNRLELEKDDQAGPALKRMHEILNAASPYGLIKDAENLISTVGTVNRRLVDARRQEATEAIDKHLATLKKDVEDAKGDAGLRSACLEPLERLKKQVQTQESLAHITQAETEALKAYDAASARIEEFVKKASETTTGGGSGTTGTKVKTKRVVKPAAFVQSPYLETKADVDGFLDKLRMELEQAIANDERVEIR